MGHAAVDSSRGRLAGLVRQRGPEPAGELAGRCAGEPRTAECVLLRKGRVECGAGAVPGWLSQPGPASSRSSRLRRFRSATARRATARREHPPPASVSRTRSGPQQPPSRTVYRKCSRASCRSGCSGSPGNPRGGLRRICGADGPSWAPAAQCERKKCIRAPAAQLPTL